MSDHNIVSVDFSIKLKMLKQVPQKIYLYIWSQYIHQIAVKANCTLSLINRNLKLASKSLCLFCIGTVTT